jgi:hypothetical protein
MAAADDLDGNVQRTDPMTTVAILTADDFGASFAKHLARVLRAHGQQVTEQALESGPGTFAWQPGALVVLAGGSRMLRSSQDTDRRPPSGRVAWMPVIRHSGKLWIGPVLGLRGGPCAGCYEGRRGQHGLLAPAGRSVTPRPAVLAVAAGLAAWVARPVLRPDDSSQDLGQLAACDEATATFRFHEVIPIHGCRCRAEAA